MAKSWMGLRYTPSTTADCTSARPEFSGLSPRVTLIALAMLPLAACTRPAVLGWSPAAARGYLNRRAEQWLTWRSAARARGTVCISCHTALPYLLASDALETRESYIEIPSPHAKLLASVLERVTLGTRLPPYYPRQAAASRATEAVLNALILTDRDAPTGRMSAPAEAALAAMWAQQTTSGGASGSWPWIQFDNEPWEAADSGYFGATMAALAIGNTPQEYRHRPSLQSGLIRLQEYLARAYESQPLLNRIDLLWATTRWPALMTPAARDSLLKKIWTLQRSDGGWNSASLMPTWHRSDGTSQPSGSDGYATGLITLALERSGVPSTDTRLQRGLHWLRGHQSWTGHWSASSLNRHYYHRDGLQKDFMNDAATAYALLALMQTSGQAVNESARR